ncbi:helix-turn-helix domain-containing protein [Solicola gregarius]|uniref:Helix-turn-helix domain-containing protein n=1 Tax=Solicola gregarius TaxID=2908642 RepID=A0AA46TGD6_9ACTN|nr:helix-turn-helix domain-containing protein [Solicola gregarius]UYM04655.1 helix-turn-helix domain-containing protein [Solicola gregarius]
MSTSDPGEGYDDLVLVCLAALGRGTEAELGVRTGLAPGDVVRHLDALARDDLVTRSDGDRWEIAGPEELDRDNWVADLRNRFARESAASPERSRPPSDGGPPQRPGIRTYIGARTCLAVHFQLLEQAEASIWVLDRPPYLGGLPLPDDSQPDNPEMRAFSRGVDVRGVYKARFRGLARLWYLREFAQAGVPVRIGPAPLKLAIIDQRVAYIPTLRSYDVLGHVTALVVWDPALVQVLIEVFEECWANARPVPIALASEDDDRRSELIVMLLAGYADAAIARALGVTERTVRRWVRDLLTLIGSETRLQLGAALAAYRDSPGDVR